MESENTIQPREIFGVIKKRIKLILIITILSALTSGILNYYGSKPVYRAETSILVGNSEGEKITASDVTMYQNLIKTYIQIAQSRKVAEITAENLNQGATASDVQNSVQVNNIAGTQVISISAESQNPKFAADMANVFAKAFSDEAENMFTSGNAEIIDQALVPNAPIYADKIKNTVVACLVGLIGSILLAFVLEYMDKTIKTLSDVKKYFNNQIIGVIPQNEVSELIVKNQPESLESQAYKTLRTNIQFPNRNSDLHSILIASAGPNEGKTTVTGNLALAIAQSGKKVLLIDCNLRKPSLHKMFHVDKSKGLSEVLIDGDKKTDCIVNVFENLDLLTSGSLQRNSSEILSSQKMSDFIKELEIEYDNIIIDSPAIFSVTDAQILAAKVDGVVYVIGSHESSIEACVRSKELLNAVNANIIGVVLNKVSNKFEGMNWYYSSKRKKSKSNRKVRNEVQVARS